MNQPQMPPPGHPRPQKQGMSTSKKLGLGCGGLFLMLFLLGGCVAVLSGGSTDNSAPSSQADSDTEEGNTETSEEEEAAEEEPEEESEIVLTAETREFNPSILHDSGAYTSVFVTVENNSDEDIEINPLYFSIVADDGTKKDTSGGLGMDEDQIDTLTLSPGQRAEGTVTVEGDITPASVEFGGPLGLGEAHTVDIQ